MDDTIQLSKQVVYLQRRVRVLTVAFVVALSIVSLLVALVTVAIVRIPNTVRAHRVEADIVVADSITVRSSQAGTDSIVLGAGKSGAHVFLNDSENRNRVRLNGNGIYIADTAGKHAITLGLSPGPGDLHAPFMLLRDRAGKERISLGLHAESDNPNIRLAGTNASQSTEISADAVMVYNTDGRIYLHNSLKTVPYLELRGLVDGGSRESTTITPATRARTASSNDAR